MHPILLSNGRVEVLASRAVPCGPGLQVCLLNLESGLLQSLAWMCCPLCLRGPLSGLLLAAVDNAGSWAGLPRLWILIREAPFDVSGERVTLTFSSYAVGSVILSVCHWILAITAQIWH